MSNLVLLGSGLEPYRRYVLESLREAGFELILVAENEPTWEQPFILGYLKIDLRKSDLVKRSLDALRKRQQIDGILTFVESNVPLMIECQTHFGLPGPAAATARSARDKGAMREAFERAGMFVPRVQRVPDITEFDPATDCRIAFPLVIKPAMGFASINVQKVCDAAELAQAVENCRRGRLANALHLGKTYLLESFIEGPEFSIESVESEGAFTHFGIVRKYTTDLPFFEEFAHIAGDPDVAGFGAEAERAAEAACRAVGIAQVAAHTEFKVTANGIAIIEVAARLAGDHIPRIVRLASGDDPVRATAHANVGQPLPAKSNAKGRVVGVIFFTPRHAGVLRRQPDHELLRNLPGVLEFKFLAPTGKTYEVPPAEYLERFGYAVCEGASRAVVEQRLNHVVDVLGTQTDVGYYQIGRTG